MAHRINLELTDEQLDTLIEWRQSVNEDKYFVMLAEPLLDTGVLKVVGWSGDRATKVYAIIQAALDDVKATERA